MISASLVKELREITGAGMMDCKKALEEVNGNIDEAIDWLREKGISKAAKKEGRIAAEGLTNVLVDGDRAVVLELNSETDFVAKNEEFKELLETLTNTIVKNDADTMEKALSLNTGEESISDLIVSKTATIGEKLSFRRFERIVKKDNEHFGSYIHMGGKISVLVLVEGSNAEVAKDVAMHVAAMKPSYLRREDVSKEELDKERSIIKEQAINEGKLPDIAEKMVEGRIIKFYKENCLEEQAFVKDGDISVVDYVKKNGGRIVLYIRYEVGEGLEKRNDDFASEVMNQVNK